MKLAEQLEQEGVDIIQTEGGKCSSPSKAGVLGLIEKVNERNITHIYPVICICEILKTQDALTVAKS